MTNPNTGEIAFLREQIAELQSKVGDSKIKIAKLEESKLDAAKLVEIMATLERIETKLKIAWLLGGGAVAVAMTQAAAIWFNAPGK